MSKDRPETYASAGSEQASAATTDERRRAIRERADEFLRHGAGPLQAAYMALEEAWKTEVAENERLWDQAEELRQAHEAEDEAHAVVARLTQKNRILGTALQQLTMSSQRGLVADSGITVRKHAASALARAEFFESKEAESNA